MQWFSDLNGREIRLTDERAEHIHLNHPELFDFDHTIAETLEAPDFIERDDVDREVRNYWRWYNNTNMGDKGMIVTAAVKPDDAFILSARIQSQRR